MTTYNETALKNAVTDMLGLVVSVPEERIQVTMVLVSNTVTCAVSSTQKLRPRAAASLRRGRSPNSTNSTRTLANGTAEVTASYKISYLGNAEDAAKQAVEALNSLERQATETIINAYLPVELQIAVTSVSAVRVSVRAVGDPHMVNVRGEKFDILRPGKYTFLSVPRSVPKRERFLSIQALVRAPMKKKGGRHRRKHSCSGELFITALRVEGEWLGPLGSLQFHAKASKRLSVNGSGPLGVAEFAGLVPADKFEAVRHRPKRPANPYNHVDYLTVRLRFGPSNITVGWAHNFKPKLNWLWVSAAGLEHLDADIGGIMGEDSHALAASRPDRCERGPGADGHEYRP